MENTTWQSIDKILYDQQNLCLPLDEGKYCIVLDVVILLEKGGVNDYVKEMNYIEQYNKNTIVDSTTNKGIFFFHVVGKVI